MITNLNTWKLIKESIDQVQKNGEDLLVYKKDAEKEGIEKLDGNEWQVTSIIDVVQDPKNIEKLDKAFENGGNGNLSTDLVAKNVSVGDTLYLTVMLKPRNNSTAYSVGEIGVIQVKCTNVYRGTAKLNQLKQSGKLFN